MVFPLNVNFACVSVVDPCVNFEGCGDNAMCTNINNQAQCECKAGYQGDGEECNDINECLEEGEDGHKCDMNAVCSNTDGCYTCVCLEGFKGNGKECRDVDECDEVYICF